MCSSVGGYLLIFLVSACLAHLTHTRIKIWTKICLVRKGCQPINDQTIRHSDRVVILKPALGYAHYLGTVF